MRSTTLAKKIAALTLTKKAHNVVIMDLRPLTSMTDFFVVCSADSDIQIRAIGDVVVEGLEKKGVDPWHREAGSVNWLLLDYVDVVLHVFHKNTRSFYNLEKLWGDAEITKVADTTPVPRKTPARRKPARRAPHRPRKVGT